MASLLSIDELNKIFEYSEKSFKKEIKRCEAINYLKNYINTHSPDSLAMYVDNYRYLRTGVPYGRNMSNQILEFFLEQINLRFGSNALNLAVKSLYYHIIKYYHQTGIKQNSDLLIGRKIVEKYNLSYNFDDDLFLNNVIKETEDDKNYINEVNMFIGDIDQKKHVEKLPKGKKVVNQNVYIRDIKVALHALANANYSCEIDKGHPTFIRKTSNKNYTEPHHLIPLSFQSKFKNNLDVENNIVSLCSNCHNKLHYGKDIKDDLYKLYKERENLLKDAGIYISFEELLNLYK